MVADNQQHWQADGQSAVTGGVSSALAPDTIRADQLAWAVNCNLRDGKPETPWGLVERAVLPFGIIQGVKEFAFGGGRLVMSINGRIYTMVPDFNEVDIQEVQLPGQRSADLKYSYMLDSAGSFLIQDGISSPVIFDGVSIRNPIADELPLGKQMATDGQRVWLIRGRTLIAGNIITGEYQSELLFTEGQTFTGGGSFTLPSAPTGLAFMPSSSATTGFGVLLAFGIDWTIAFKANLGDRSAWLSTPGFKTNLFPKLGCRSHYSIVTSNSDIYWIDTQGEVRNLRQAASDYEFAGSTAISREISRLMDHQSENLLEGAHSIVFKNKMISTSSPFFVYQNFVAYRNMFSLDFAPISTQGEKRLPTFDGERDGIFFTHLATLNRLGQERAYAISKDSDGTNRLWEIVPEEKTDIYLTIKGDRKVSRIESDITYRAFKHTSNFVQKTFARVDFWLSRIQGQITGSIYYKRDQDPQWIKIDDFDFCAIYQDESQDDPHKFRLLAQGHHDQFISRSPAEEGEALLGHDFQIRFLIKGVFRMEKVLIWADPIDTPVYSQQDTGAEDCNLQEVELISEEYHIPVEKKTLLVYTDENGVSYVDENNEEYEG